MGLGGLEPPTSRLSSARSNQLSYKPLDCAVNRLSPPRRTSRKADRPSRLVPRPRGAPAPEGCDAARERKSKSFAEERETKAADPLKVCATVRLTIFCLVPRELKGRGSTDPSEDGRAFPLEFFLRKEVIQPQVPLRLPCYDFTPVADPTVVACLLAVSTAPSGKTNSHGVTGGVYKARERIHRGMLIRDY